MAASSEKVEAMLQIAHRAWNSIPGGPAYGYGHLAISRARPVFDPRAPRAGGKAALKTKLNGLRIEPLQHGGLLVVATDSPLPEATADTRERFLRLDEALQPAFISREQVTEMKRGMLRYFYRERPPMR